MSHTSSSIATASTLRPRQVMASKYDSSSIHVFTAALHGFAATLTNNVVAGLRCAVSVANIEHDAAFRAY